YTGEHPQHELTLYVYDGADASFELYEDEGDNYNYEKGQHGTIAFTYEQANGTLTIGECVGKFAGMLKNRVFHVVLVSDQNQVGIDSPQGNRKTVRYRGKSTSIVLK